MTDPFNFAAIVIGASAGGFTALKILLAGLPENFALPMAIVQHMAPHADNYMAEYLDAICALKVREAEDKDSFIPGNVYLAPAGYHLLIGPDKTFSLSIDEKVNFSRPAIDPLFESAASVFGSRLIAILLTGANADGAEGMRAVKRRSGLAIVQDPADAEYPRMPMAAMEQVIPDHMAPIHAMAPLLVKLCGIRREA